MELVFFLSFFVILFFQFFGIGCIYMVELSLYIPEITTRLYFFVFLSSQVLELVWGLTCLSRGSNHHQPFSGRRISQTQGDLMMSAEFWESWNKWILFFSIYMHPFFLPWTVEQTFSQGVSLARENVLQFYHKNRTKLGHKAQRDFEEINIFFAATIYWLQ